MYNKLNKIAERSFTMKKATIYILFMCMFATMSFATYYEITTDVYTPGLTLHH